MRTLTTWLLLGSSAFAGKAYVILPNDAAVPNRVVTVRKDSPADWRNANVVTDNSPPIPNGTTFVDLGIRLLDGEDETSAVASHPLASNQTTLLYPYWKIEIDQNGDRNLVDWSQAEVDAYNAPRAKAAEVAAWYSQQINTPIVIGGNSYSNTDESNQNLGLLAVTLKIEVDENISTRNETTTLFTADGSPVDMTIGQALGVLAAYGKEARDTRIKVRKYQKRIADGDLNFTPGD